MFFSTPQQVKTMSVELDGWRVAEVVALSWMAVMSWFGKRFVSRVDRHEERISNIDKTLERVLVISENSAKAAEQNAKAISEFHKESRENTMLIVGALQDK